MTVSVTPTGLTTTPIPSGTSYELIATYDLARLEHIVGKELDDFMSSSTQPTAYRGKLDKPKYAVNLYRVTYRSTVPEHDNAPTIASGLVAIPDVPAGVLPVVSYQHGTVFSRTDVPSFPENSGETRIMVAQFAAQGYAVIAADYFGRGISDLPDSFLARDSTRQAVFDFTLNARSFLQTRGYTIGHFFVSGWSQGGWVTMQFLHKLQSSGVPVSAAAIASAPVDIYLTVNRWMNWQPGDAVYIPGTYTLHLLSQEYYLQQQGLAELAIRPEYLAAARKFYAGTMSWEEFARQTPSKLPDYLNADFIRSGFTGDTLYWKTIQASNAYRWRCTVPLRDYHGGKDEVTAPYVAQLPTATQTFLGGAPAVSVDAGADADHRGIFVYGVIDQKFWFDTIANMR